jgi:hypothetical protein
VSASVNNDRPSEICEDARERVIFALEVGSNDPRASDEVRAKAERLLHLQRRLAQIGHS